MITNPTPQRELRGHRHPRPRPRVANSADHQARLAARLTPRDRWLLRMLHEHRVLTTPQITALAFPSARSAAQRLLELYTCSVVDRFQPFVTLGTAPMHYVLAPAGAAVVAAEHGLTVKDLGYRHDRAMAISHNLRLAHTVGVNDWFAALVAHARHTPNGTVRAWWSEQRCARHFGDLVRPDAYGRWANSGHEVEFFLEFDFGTEALGVVAAKLTGYAHLAVATGITTPVLVWLANSRREATARRLLTNAWHTLDDPRAVPIATATAGLLDPDQPHPSPAAPIWLPLGSTCTPRRHLHDLPHAWPHLVAPAPHEDIDTSNDDQSAANPTALPPASPMPPPPSTPPTRR